VRQFYRPDRPARDDDDDDDDDAAAAHSICDIFPTRVALTPATACRCPSMANTMCGRACLQQEAQLMLTTGSTRLAVNQGQQT